MLQHRHPLPSHSRPLPSHSGRSAAAVAHPAAAIGHAEKEVPCAEGKVAEPVSEGRSGGSCADGWMCRHRGMRSAGLCPREAKIPLASAGNGPARIARAAPRFLCSVVCESQRLPSRVGETLGGQGWAGVADGAGAGVGSRVPQESRAGRDGLCSARSPAPGSAGLASAWGRLRYPGATPRAGFQVQQRPSS